MTSRFVNLAILALLALELVSGLASFTAGTSGSQWLFWLHALGGFGLAVLIPWKWTISLRSIRRRGTGPWLALPTILVVLFFASLVTGVLWSTTGLPRVPVPVFGRWTGLTLHVALSFALLIPLLPHLFLRWPHTRPIDFLSRRAALRGAGILGAGTGAWLATELFTSIASLSGARRRFTGSREEGSFAGNRHPVTNWFLDSTQYLDPASWRLVISGSVAGPRSLSLEDLSARAPAQPTATLDCTGGWYTVQTWHGVPLGPILDEAGPTPGAGSVVVRSATGYWRRFSLDEARNFTLALRVGDETLAPAHGFPLRLVAPGHRGYDWVKWVVELELSDAPEWWQPPLPLR